MSLGNALAIETFSESDEKTKTFGDYACSFRDYMYIYMCFMSIYVLCVYIYMYVCIYIYTHTYNIYIIS